MAIKKNKPAAKGSAKPGAAKKKGPSWDEIAKKAEGNFAKSRENADDGGFKVPTIDDGVYTAVPKKFKVGTFAEKIVAGKLKPAGMWVMLTFVVTDGEFEGTSVPMRFNPNTPAQMDFMCGQLARFGYDLSKFKLAELPKFLADVCKEAPSVQLKVANSSYEGKPQLQVYLNGLTEEA